MGRCAEIIKALLLADSTSHTHHLHCVINCFTQCTKERLTVFFGHPLFHIAELCKRNKLDVFVSVYLSKLMTRCMSLTWSGHTQIIAVTQGQLQITVGGERGEPECV